LISFGATRYEKRATPSTQRWSCKNRISSQIPGSESSNALDLRSEHLNQNVRVVWVDSMPFAVHKEASVTIQLPDGIKLACTLWIPAARVQKDASVITTPHRFPAILEYLPYRKSDWTSPRDECRHAYFAGHGYLVARVDMRGSGNSGKAGPFEVDAVAFPRTRCD